MDKLKRILEIIKNKIFGTLASLNLHCDRIKNPRRFFLILVFAFGPWLVLDFMGLMFDHRGFDSVGFLWIVLIVVVRILWVKGVLNKYLPADK